MSFVSGGATKMSDKAAMGMGRRKLRNDLREAFEFFPHTREQEIPIG